MYIPYYYFTVPFLKYIFIIYFNIIKLDGIGTISSTTVFPVTISLYIVAEV